MSTTDDAGRPGLQLAPATGGFAVCFAVFGSVSATMPILKERLNLTPVQVSLAVAVPVIFGSLGRIPLGIMTDARGGRVVFLGAMACAIVPTVLPGWVAEYWQLLALGFLVGVGLASVSVGVGFVNGWDPGAAGGLGGFFPPLALGAIRQATGSFTWGFVFLAAFSLASLVVCRLTATRRPAA